MNPASKLNSKYAFKIPGQVTELMMGLGRVQWRWRVELEVLKPDINNSKVVSDHEL
jgi:hypothetical protein